MATTEASPKLAGVPKLLMDTLKSQWNWKGILLAVTAIVAVPAAIFSWLANGGDASTSAYTTLAGVFMNVALINTINRRVGQQKTSLSTAYYEGTAATVRFILLVMMLVGMAVPLIIGAMIYTAGTYGQSPAASGMELVLLGLVWLVLALPSLYWLSRSVFAIFEVDTGQRPVAAIRRSWGRVNGFGLAVFGRLMVLVAILLALITLPAYVLFSSRLSETWLAASLTMLQALTTMVVLPFVFIYLRNLYQELPE